MEVRRDAGNDKYNIHNNKCHVYDFAGDMAEYKEMIETVAEHCIHKDCKYRSRSTLIESCDYMLVTNRPRGCNISKCDKYETGKKKLVSTLGGFRYEQEDDWW